MLKRVLIIGFLLGFAWSANAQIATPVFDNGFPTYSAAATGWRQNSSIAILYFTAEGDLKSDGTKVGTVKAGAAAEGDGDSSNMPSLMGVLKTETVGAELYLSTLKTDFEADFTISSMVDLTSMSLGVYDAAYSQKIYKEDKETRAQFSYLLGESLSLGLGYRQIGITRKTVSTATVVAPDTVLSALPTTTVVSQEVTKETTETAMAITASWQMAEMFYLALGMESVSLTGSKRTVANQSMQASSASDTKANYVDNAWTNTIFGLGLLTGEPGDTQFRVEYSMASSPESKKEASGAKLESSRPKTTQTYMNLEAKFGDIFISAKNEKEMEAKMDEEEQTVTTTWVGLGWQPESGITVSAYSFAREVVNKDSNGEMKFLPSGYRINVGFNF